MHFPQADDTHRRPGIDVAILFATSSAILWAFGQVVMKLGIANMPLGLFGFIRAAVSLVFVIPFGLLGSGFHFPEPTLIVIAFLGGLLDSFVGTLLYMKALKNSPAYEAVPLANTAPFWGVIAAVLFLGETPRFVAFAAAVLVVLGAYFLVKRGDGTTTRVTTWAPWVALAAGVVWGIAEIAPVKYCLTRGMDPVTYQLMVIVGAGFGWGLYTLFRGKTAGSRFSRRGIGIAILTGFTNLFLGWILWLAALQRGPASLLAPVRGSVALFGFAFSIVLLKERPSVRSAIGVLMVVGGVMLVTVA